MNLELPLFSWAGEPGSPRHTSASAPSPTAVVIGMGTCLAFPVGVGGPKLRSSCFHIKGLTHGAFFSALNIIFNLRFFLSSS